MTKQYSITGRRDSSVSVITGLLYERSKNQGLIPGRKGGLSVPQCVQRVWDLTAILFKEYQGIFTQLLGDQGTADHKRPFNAQEKMLRDKGLYFPHA